jgi:hypothetical protein
MHHHAPITMHIFSQNLKLFWYKPISIFLVWFIYINLLSLSWIKTKTTLFANFKIVINQNQVFENCCKNIFLSFSSNRVPISIYLFVP